MHNFNTDKIQTMNRTVISIVAIFCLLMQISWASAATYCEHHSLHVNHQATSEFFANDVSNNKQYEHERHADSDTTMDANSASDIDCDCSACHAPTAFAFTAALNINLSALTVDANTLLLSMVSSPVLSRLERPNWVSCT
jgi:hypothetical protein